MLYNSMLDFEGCRRFPVGKWRPYCSPKIVCLAKFCDILRTMPTIDTWDLDALHALCWSFNANIVMLFLYARGDQHRLSRKELKACMRCKSHTAPALQQHWEAELAKLDEAKITLNLKYRLAALVPSSGYASKTGSRHK